MELRKAGSGLWNFLIELQSNFSKRQRTYIVPTGFGVTFAVVILVLFFLAAGYANNLVFLVVFFLVSISLTTVYWTNRNVDIVKVTSIQALRGFAGGGCPFQVELQNKNRKRSAEALRVLFIHAKKRSLAVENVTAPANAKTRIEFQIVFSTRGLHSFPVLILESTFPFGMLRAWKVLKEKKSVLVYPQRAGTLPFPLSADEAAQLHSSGLFRDHRLFQTGDSVRHIDWRASARRQELLIKNFEESQKPALHFSWEQTDGVGDTEARLSQLALWVDEAEKMSLEYSLKIADKYFEPSRGANHYHQCLEALALVKDKDLLR